MMRNIHSVLFALLISVSSLLAGSAGSIAGKAVDGKGVGIPAATVRLSRDGAPPLETITEDDGSFSFADLAPGEYKLEIEMAGFQKLSRERIDPGLEISRTLLLTLARAQSAPPRSFRGARPMSAQNGAAAGPSRGAAGTPGVSGELFAEIEISGIRAENSEDPSALESRPAMRTDGADVLVISGNTTASMDAGDWNDPNFRERVTDVAQRMGFGGMDGPGFDRQGEGPGRGGAGFAGPGGGPAGGGFGPMGGGMGGRGFRMRQSKLNGNAFNNVRNSIFNARNYSLTGAQVPKPLQIQNNYGLSFGGPLPWGPKPSPGQGRGQGRGRSAMQAGMWFFSYEGSRNRNPFTVLTTVPTALERSGDFSQTSLRAGPLAGQSIILNDPAARAASPFPEARIPSFRIDPIAASLLKFIPLPNLPGTVQNFLFERGLPSTSDSFSGRVNTPVSKKDNIFFNYGFRKGDSLSSQIFPGLDTERVNSAHNVAIGGTHRFQPRLIANYNVSFNRVHTSSTNPFSYNQDIAGRLGISGISRDPINFGIPAITFTNYGDLQLGSPSLNRTQTLTAGGGLNKIGTRHTIRIGGDVGWNQRNSQVDPNARGTFDFTGFATSAFSADGRPVAGTGYDLADFLLGLPYSTSRRFGSSANYLRNRNYNIFVQDNWRVRSNLTVNVGLRYEYIEPFHEKYNRIVSLDAAPGFAAVAPVFPDQIGPYTGRFPQSLLFGDKNNFGPRIGIAWKRKPDSKWVFRAGYGLFYNPSVYPYIYSQLVGQPPFAIGQNILTTSTEPLTLANGFPEDPSVTIRNSYAVDPHYRIGYVQQWNLNIQTQFLKLYAVEVGYNGARGTRLDVLRAPNRAPAGSGPGSTEDNRTISNAESFVYQESGANSILHSMRIRAVRRFSHGFRLDSSFVLSKSIDNASGIGGSALLVVQDDRNILAERSLSSFDQRHRFDVNFNFELPFGENRRFMAAARPFLQQIFAGWNLNGSYQLYSGTPLTARILGNVSNNSGTGSNLSERPDSTGISSALPGGERSTASFFNTNAFTIPQPGKFGNAGRNTVAGPGTNLLNLSLRKNFRLDDNNRRLDFRWQVSNILNHPNWAGLATVVNALNFGRVTSVRSMRQMEFQLRISF